MSDLRAKKGEAMAPAGPPPTFTIPEDSPFAAAKKAAPTTAAAAPATEPFSFSFSLPTTSTANGASVATFDLAAPVVASDKPVVVPAPKPTDSRKIRRRKKGGPAQEEEEQEQWWDEGEEGEEWDADGGDGEPSPKAAAAPAFSFDASKFEMSSFAQSLPPVEPLASAPKDQP